MNGKNLTTKGEKMLVDTEPKTEFTKVVNTKVRVYIAGPYSNDDPGRVAMNVLAAVEAGDKIAKAGYFVFIPHLNHYWHKFFEHDWQFWMDQDDAWLEVCDALVRIGGASRGADQEVERAKTLGLPVFYGTEEFFHAQYS
jgi:hypothetical protein